jgi:trimethylamine--corrinoid protein Co-methyltransferase
VEPVTWVLRPASAEVDVQALHVAAVAILARTGMAVHHPQMRSELLRRPGFSERQGRVLIEPACVETWLAAHRRRHPGPLPVPRSPVPPERWRFGLLEYASWVVCDGGQALRPLTRADAVAGTRLAEVLRERGVQPCVPGVPQDVPPALRPLEQYLIGVENSSAGGCTALVADLQTAAVIRELDRACGRGFQVSVWLPNTLVFGGPNADILWHFRQEVQAASVGSMTLMGVSGPCDPLALMAVCLAEVLGGAAILHALLPDLPVSIFVHPQPADMRTGTLMLGAPEGEVLDLLKREVLHWYGIPWNSKPVHTSAALPGCQAQIERSTALSLGALAGCDSFFGLGVLGIDEVWSPAQLVLDLDVAGHAGRIAQGAASAPGLGLERLPEVVHEVLASGSPFLAHATTLEGFRQQYELPRVLKRLDRAQWAAGGRPDAYHDAEAQARELVSRFAYEPPADLLREVRGLCDWGRQRLGGNR